MHIWFLDEIMGTVRIGHEHARALARTRKL
jgi:hypothetical protein